MHLLTDFSANPPKNYKNSTPQKTRMNRLNYYHLYQINCLHFKKKNLIFWDITLFLSKKIVQKRVTALFANAYKHHAANSQGKTD
jgi:hypothetical protein